MKIFFQLLGKFLCQLARHEIVAAAGGESRNHPHRLGRIIDIGRSGGLPAKSAAPKANAMQGSGNLNMAFLHSLFVEEQ